MRTLVARSGAHVIVRKGQSLKVAQTQGSQVVDFWAFSPPPWRTHISYGSESNPPTYLSMTHTRSYNEKLSVVVGDVLRNNQRQPMLTLTEDTSPGVHDSLFAACDRHRYRQLGVNDYHPSCSDNLHAELKKAAVAAAAAAAGLEVLPASNGGSDAAVPPQLTGIGPRSMNGVGENEDAKWTPDPLNLFMNVPVSSVSDGTGGELQIERPRSQVGDFVVLRAEMDVLVVMSACPMDLNDVNGGGGIVRDVGFEVF